MTISGTCHCGATRFEVATVPTEAVECNCTYCSKAGGLWAYYEPEDFSAAGPDRVYSKTGYNKHHFCPTCGCQTYGVSPKWSLDGSHELDKFRIGVNVRLLDDFDPAGLTITKMDGRHLW
ncbi:hypothetical protein XM25_14370 [Devosia sp. H5989]|nr:hypothetical protein XM25_14370 [Devosia sp. H5989]